MILFLDFDGVLHPRKDGPEPLFCRAALLWHILRSNAGIKVVFSTSWREYFSHEELVERVTAGGGEDLAHRFIGKTPRIDKPIDRRDVEVRAWLKHNSPDSAWIAIDDQPMLFKHWQRNLYVTDAKVGLTDADVSSILERMQKWNNR